MIKKFTLEAEYNTCTDSFQMNSENEGFNAFELLGILECKKQDVINQVYNPNNFGRNGSQIVYKGDD